MTTELFRQDSYLQQCSARVMCLHALIDGSFAVELDRTVFYPLKGRQAGDGGMRRITDAELDAKPCLVKSTSFSPPRGSGVTLIGDVRV